MLCKRVYDVCVRESNWVSTFFVNDFTDKESKIDTRSHIRTHLYTHPQPHTHGCRGEARTGERGINVWQCVGMCRIYACMCAILKNRYGNKKSELRNFVTGSCSVLQTERTHTSTHARNPDAKFEVTGEIGRATPCNKWNDTFVVMRTNSSLNNSHAWRLRCMIGVHFDESQPLVVFARKQKDSPNKLNIHSLNSGNRGNTRTLLPPE